MQLYTAQVWDVRAGLLAAADAQGGPGPLVGQEFYWGINDPLGADHTGRPFDPTVFTLYDAWSSSSGTGDPVRQARAAIARGQEIFNHKPLAIVGVSGLNDDLGVASIPGTCTTCHDTPNAGNHSVPAPLRIGIDAVQPVGGLNVAGLPIYTLRNLVTGDARANDRPRAGADHRPVEGHRSLQGADAEGPRRSRALLPQRLGGTAGGRDRLLRRAFPDRADRAGEGQSPGLPRGALSRPPASGPGARASAREAAGVEAFPGLGAGARIR